ncbi:MAG: hypothetical protein ABIL25_04345 [candidate division WOR-3 bacterium]
MAACIAASVTTCRRSSCHAVAVECIFANGSQARRRRERINQSFQDRLVAELDHHRITDPLRATDYLNRVFIPKYAERFGVKPREPEPALRPVADGLDLRTMLCAKTTRQVANDNTLRYHGHRYELKLNVRSVCIAGTKVTVWRWFDGTVHIRYDRVGEIPHIRLQHQPKLRRTLAESAYDTFVVVQV